MKHDFASFLRGYGSELNVPRQFFIGNKTLPARVLVHVQETKPDSGQSLRLV